MNNVKQLSESKRFTERINVEDTPRRLTQDTLCSHSRDELLYPYTSIDTVSDIIQFVNKQCFKILI